MYLREKVIDFCNRFDVVMRESQLCDDNDPIFEGEHKVAFYKVEFEAVPEIITIELIQALKDKNLDYRFLNMNFISPKITIVVV